MLQLRDPRPQLGVRRDELPDELDQLIAGQFLHTGHETIKT